MSEDGRSAITIEFAIDRDIDGAANDVRDRVSGILDQVPVEAEPRDIQTVPLAMAGTLLGLWFTGQSMNICSEIGLIMLVGLAAKNGILIVEFANQLRDQGREFREALLEAADVRLRPIVMTDFTTAAGSIPLLLSSGAGTETRVVIGTVILSGVLAATLFVVPITYDLPARHTGSPGDVKRQLEAEAAEDPGKGGESATRRASG